MERSVRMCARCVYVLVRFGTDLYAQSVLSNKISAPDVSRKFIKSALLVGQQIGNTTFFFQSVVLLLSTFRYFFSLCLLLVLKTGVLLYLHLSLAERERERDSPSFAHLLFESIVWVAGGGAICLQLNHAFSLLFATIMWETNCTGASIEQVITATEMSLL